MAKQKSTRGKRHSFAKKSKTASPRPKLVLDLLSEFEKKWNEPDFSYTLSLIQSLSPEKARKTLAKEVKRAGAHAQGPQTCAALLELGIRQFDLGERSEAEETFKRGLAMAQAIMDASRTGWFLHELSIVSWDKGDYPQAVAHARDALIAKLRGFLSAAQRTGFEAYMNAPIEPLAAIVRLSTLLSLLQQREDARVLSSFLMDAYESHSDLPLLAGFLLNYGVLALQLGRQEEADWAMGRAFWISKICDLKLSLPLARNDLGDATRPADECPVLSDTGDREKIEESLIAQYREIALGLLADRLLKNHMLSERCWWHQFCSQRRLPPPYLEDEEDAEFQAFQDEIFQSVALRRIKRISPADLLTRPIKFGKIEFFCWQDGKINRYLAEIGSSLRLFMAGSDISRATALLGALGHAPLNPACPSDFILGRVAPMTALGKAVLFDFSIEYAVSPYLNPDSPALHDRGRVVSRHFLLACCVEALKTRPRPSEDDLRANLDIGTLLRFEMVRAHIEATGVSLADLDDQWREDYCKNLGITHEEMMANGFLSHEMGHVMQQFPMGKPGLFSSWHAILRDDICRFTQTPRSFAEIRAAFRRNFEGLGEQQYYQNFLTFFTPGDSPVTFPLQQILDDLCHDRLLECLPEGQYHFRGFVSTPA